MRVVHIESGLHLYGGARQVCNLLSGLSAEGIENTLICPRDSAIAGSLGGPGSGIEVIEIPMRGDLDIALPGRLRNLLASHRPDLVHVHSRRGADRFGGWNARWAGVCAVLTRRVESAEFKPLARLKYQPYAAIVAISRAIETQLLDAVGLARNRVHYVASGVDTEHYRPAASQGRLTERFSLPDGSFTIGVVAQLIQRKGHARLLAVLPELIARHPAVKVLLFGRGPLQSELTRQVQDLGLTAHVTFAGFCGDLETLLPELDCLVHPAEREGLGVAVLEAMSCEVPVVVNGVGGLVDVVEHGSSGLIADIDNPMGILAAVEQLIRDPDLRATLGEAARKRVQNLFSMAGMTRGNLSVYREVLKHSYGNN